MHYNLMVTGFDNSKSKTIVARLLASRNSSIPYQKALAMMEAPPVVLFEDIDSEEMAEHVVQFKKIGVRFKAIAVQPAVQARESEIPSTPPMHKPVLITGTPVLSEHKGIPSRTSDISEVPEKKRKWYTMKRFHLGAFAVVAAYILVMTFLFRIQKTRSPLSGGDLQNGNAMSRVTGTADKKKAHEKKTINSVRDNHPVADKKLKKATAFVDSARQYASDDPMKAVKFYKMAISFNKYNINAWFGLLGAYRDLGMKKEEAEAQKKMKAVFGEDIFSINGIVHPFG